MTTSLSILKSACGRRGAKFLRRGKLWANAVLVFGSLALPCCSADKQQDRCEGPFEEVTQICPKSFDGIFANLPPCEYFPAQSVRTCGHLIVLTYEGGYTFSECFFDLTSHELVGGALESDIPDFCGMTSYVEETGKVPDSSCHDMAPVVHRDCNGSQDAGSPD